MVIKINREKRTPFTFVKQSICTASDGRVCLLEQDVETGQTRKRPLIIRNERIYAAEYEVE